MEGFHLERPVPALARLDTAIGLLSALGHKEETETLSAVAAELRDE